MMRFAKAGCRVLVWSAALLAPVVAHAQKVPVKRGQAVEIRGQVPTPQVVTVRPREVPAYDRQILSPSFYSGNESVTSAGAVQLVPESQVRGTAGIDTAPLGIARDGSMTGDNGPNGARSALSRGENGGPAAARAGASTAEIESMRKELEIRRARLDSLRRALHAQMPTPEEAAKSSKAGRMSAADSAARVEEIEAIRKELEYRRQRLDSLQRVVKNMGKGKKQAPSKSTTPDTTAAPPSRPRGRD